MLLCICLVSSYLKLKLVNHYLMFHIKHILIKYICVLVRKLTNFNLQQLY